MIGQTRAVELPILYVKSNYTIIILNFHYIKRLLKPEARQQKDECV